MNSGISSASGFAPTGGTSVGQWQLVKYFLKLGTIGFGGPVALVSFIYRDLVESRGWVSEEDYKLGLAFSQIMPGPIAVQLAIVLGYFLHNLSGATLVALAFILPSFFMVVGLSMAYVVYGGLWWMQAAFYGIGASVIAIIILASSKLARATNKRDPLLWGIFASLFTVTVFAPKGLALLFIAAGLVVLLVRARPRWLRVRSSLLNLMLGPIMPFFQMLPPAVGPTTDILLTILLFFAKASLFVFGSGLGVLPFLYQGVVHQYGWLNERQFLDAMAVAMITPGPVTITVAFIGYLVAGLAGAAVAALGVFLPVYLPAILLIPWFKRHRHNVQLIAFVQGVTAAATGAIAGASVVLAHRAIFDLPTAALALGSLGILLRTKLPEPIVVLISGMIGLALWHTRGVF